MIADPRSRSRASASTPLSALRSMLFALVVSVTTLSSPLSMAQAAGDRNPPTFENAAEEKRFHDLVAELRCVMCQNQSLADSDAQIAKDLRREVLRSMREGRSDEEIRAFLVERYGEFVLYRPRVSGTTWLLWFGPLLVVLIGAAVAIGSARRSGKTQGDSIADDDAQEW